MTFPMIVLERTGRGRAVAICATPHWEARPQHEARSEPFEVALPDEVSRAAAADDAGLGKGHYPTRDGNYKFGAGDLRRVAVEPLYRVPETGQVLTLDEAEPGMVWEDEGRHWVRLPDGEGRLVGDAVPGTLWRIVDGHLVEVVPPDVEDHAHEAVG